MVMVNWCFTPFFNHIWLYMSRLIWRSVSTAGGTNCSWEWTSNLPLATDNYLSLDSNPIGEGRVVSKREALTTRPRKPLGLIGEVVLILRWSTVNGQVTNAKLLCCIKYFTGRFCHISSSSKFQMNVACHQQAYLLWHFIVCLLYLYWVSYNFEVHVSEAIWHQHNKTSIWEWADFNS